jgi:hypothetical protein
MKQLKDIQKLIEERAEANFNKDYWAIVSPITNSELFKDIELKCTRNGNTQESLEGMYWVLEMGMAIMKK